MQGLTIGRVVRYVEDRPAIRVDDSGNYHDERELLYFAALVTALEAPDGQISLCLFHPENGARPLQHVPYSEEPSTGTWHWPERVE